VVVERGRLAACCQGNNVAVLATKTVSDLASSQLMMEMMVLMKILDAG
jgi:hypothetical protein